MIGGLHPMWAAQFKYGSSDSTVTLNQLDETNASLTQDKGYVWRSPYYNRVTKNNPGGPEAMLWLGEQGPDFDITKARGAGQAAATAPLRYMQYYGQEIDSKGAAKNIERASRGIKSWMDKKQSTIAKNPWGTGPDAAQAALSFERSLIANREDALQDMTQLQIRQYGALYRRSGETMDVEVTSGGGEAGRTTSIQSHNAYQYIAPRGDLSAIEKYKLGRYEMRAVTTGKAIGSGYDPGYNPLGLIEDDRFQPGEFIQEEANYAPTRVADRAARQSGKQKLTTSDATSAQL